MTFTRKSGKKNRKVGRASRKPSHARYLAARRWETNKERKQRQHIKRMAKKTAKLEERLFRCQMVIT